MHPARWRFYDDALHKSTFYLLTSILPIFSLLRPSVLDLGSGTGQTDIQTETDRQRPSLYNVPPYGAGA